MALAILCGRIGTLFGRPERWTNCEERQMVCFEARAVALGKSSSPVLLYYSWCREGESNPHDLAVAGF
jgi:hypothetical protein